MPKIKLKQKSINGDIWYIWIDNLKKGEIRRINSSSGGQATFKIQNVKESFNSLKDCLKFLESQHKVL
jgi:hypothetical protein